MDVAVRAFSSMWMILLPLVLWLVLARRQPTGLRLIGVGALTFLASQVFHLPFNAWVLRRLISAVNLDAAPQVLGMILIALLFGLSAGIFEECARYLIYGFWLKDVRTWREAVTFGAGHGGIEAILLGGLALLTLFQLNSLRGVDLATVVPPEQLDLARQQVEAYWTASWSEALLPALERVLALTLHISLAVIVLLARVRRNAAWLALAIAWHAGANAVGLLALEWWGPYAAEAAIALVTAGALAIAWRLRSALTGSPEQEPVPAPARPSPARPMRRRDNLDDTRYLE